MMALPARGDGMVGWLGTLIARLVMVLVVLPLVLAAPAAAPAADGIAAATAPSPPAPQLYRCDGEPLQATLVRGPVDAPSLPDPTAGPVPVGGLVVLAWRDLRLPLPRTNNAGPASFSDGRWWWSLEDPAHPRFRQRLPDGTIADRACSAAA